MKGKNAALTAAVVLAMGATTTHATVEPKDSLLVDIASGSIIKEGQQIQTRQNHESTTKIMLAEKKATTKKKATAKKK